MFPFLQVPPLNLRNKARDGELQGVSDSDYTTSANDLVINFIVRLLELAMIGGAILSFAFLVLGSIEWITAGGDKGKIEKARDKMIGAIVGLLILSSTVVIFNIVQRVLGINVLPFTSSYTPPPSHTPPTGGNGIPDTEAACNDLPLNRCYEHPNFRCTPSGDRCEYCTLKPNGLECEGLG